MELTAKHYIILAIAYFGVLIVLAILTARQKEKIRTAEEEKRAYRKGLIFMTAPLLLPIFILMVGGVGFLFLYVFLELMPDINTTVLTIILILYGILSIFFGIKAFIAIYKSIYKFYDKEKRSGSGLD